MIHPDDVAAWIAQARQHPEAAPDIIEALAARLIELDQQNEALRDELVRLSRGREPTAGTGRVAALSRRVQTLERQLERRLSTASEEVPRSLLVFTLDGRAARLSLPAAGNWKARDDQSLVAGHLRPRHILIADDRAELLLFSDKGQVARVNVSDIDVGDAPVSYLSLLPGMAMDLDESIGVVVSLTSTFDRLTLITRKGYARSFRRAELESLLERNLPLHSSPVEGDYPAFALLSDGKRELLVATRLGKGVRFPERAVSVQSQLAINLDRGDVVNGAAIVDDETTVAILGAEGVAARRQVASFGAHATAGNRGKVLTRISDVVGVAPTAGDDTLWLLTATGKLHAIPATRVPSGTGASRGKAIVRLGEDRLVALAVA
jgi:DNA gyrase/topoisomerase IV subunit A